MKPYPLIALSLTALAVAATPAFAKEAPKAPEPSKPIDAATFFKGRWYEIGRTPLKLTDGCVAGYTDYTLNGPTKLTVRDACRDKTPSGKEKVVGGPAKILNPGENNKIRVSYRLFGVFPVKREYWILDHGEGWFIQATSDFKLINTYTRDPHPSKALVDQMTARVAKAGYDASKLEFPPVSE